MPLKRTKQNMLSRVWLAFARLWASDWGAALLIYVATRLLLGFFLLRLFPEAFIGGFNRESFDWGMGTYDGQNYTMIAERGYSSWGLIRLYAFLPGWPIILRVVAGIVPGSLNLTEIGLLLNQLLAFPLIWSWIRLGRTLRLSPTEARVSTILLMVFPASAFFTFVYNEPLFLIGCAWIVISWIEKRYARALWIAMALVAMRFTVLALVAGLIAQSALSLISHAWRGTKRVRTFLRHVGRETWRVVRERWPLGILLALTPTPLLYWFWQLEQTHGKNLFLVAEHEYFIRRIEHLGGVWKSLKDGLHIGQDPPFSWPDNRAMLAGGIVLASILILGTLHVVGPIWFRWTISGVTTLALMGTLIVSPQWFNSTIPVNILQHPLTIAWIVAGTIALAMDARLRRLLIPSLIVLYAPLATAYFASMNRYVLQAVGFTLGMGVVSARHRPLLVTLLVVGLVGQGVTFSRFVHLQWPG